MFRYQSEVQSVEASVYHFMHLHEWGSNHVCETFRESSGFVIALSAYGRNST